MTYVLCYFVFDQGEFNWSMFLFSFMYVSSFSVRCLILPFPLLQWSRVVRSVILMLLSYNINYVYI